MKRSQLTLKQRNHLETLLNENHKLCDIAASLNKDPRGIKYEIVHHRTLFVRSNLHNKCGKQNICTRTRLCNDCDSGYCKYCRHRYCDTLCPDFSNIPHCKRISRFPCVCNGCTSIKNCRLPKLYYRSNIAQIEYERNISEHKKGPKLDTIELSKLNQIISSGVKKGLSVEVIINSNNLDISVSTVYRYIDNNLFDIKNIDLKRKVRYKQRKRNSEKTRIIDYSYLDGRRFEDFTSFLSLHPSSNIWQMDTIEGIKGGEAVLSLLFTKTNLQYYFKLSSICTVEVKRVFDSIKKYLGPDLFKETFECILTDNGKENRDPVSLEIDDVTGEMLTNIFYCDPRRSDQKAKCEKNHEHFREMIPKGIDIGKYSVSDINHISNQVNNYPRKSLNYHSPLEASWKLLNEKVFELNNLHFVSPDKVVLKHLVK